MDAEKIGVDQATFEPAYKKRSPVIQYVFSLVFKNLNSSA
jgi:hypothetical protein